MNFANFLTWREDALLANPQVLDCAETNLYRALAALRPKPKAVNKDHQVHRCDLARSWLNRYGYPEHYSRRALVCGGVRHALKLIFGELGRKGALLWVPGDVYPVYLDLARAAGIQPSVFTTLPELRLPTNRHEGKAEFLLVTNPWKPLGRFLAEGECAALVEWLAASPIRYLLLDCVYDLGAPFHPTTQNLLETGRAILLHSVTKGWLWPRTFGVALLSESQPDLESAFRNAPSSPEQLQLAERLLSTHANLPWQIVTALNERRDRLFAALSAPVRNSLMTEPATIASGCYFFPSYIRAEKLFHQHGILAVPASAFGSNWDGSILTSLGGGFGKPVGGGKEMLWQ